METIETEQIESDILRCRDVAELKSHILPEMKEQGQLWSEMITRLVSLSGMTDAEFARECGFSRQTLYKWKKGHIPDRRSMMRIGLTAGYSIPQMNNLLMRYGRYPHLSLKNIDDCICEYVIGLHLQSGAARKFVDIGIMISDRATDMLHAAGEEASTAVLKKHFSEVNDDEALIRFIDENSISLYGAYTQFSDIIDEKISESYGGSVHSLADSQNWTSFMRQVVTQIRHKNCIPARKYVILLGMYLGMEATEIDGLLETARMNQLYPKNPLEGTILFALIDAYSRGLYDVSRADYDPDNIYRHVRYILQQVDIPEAGEYLYELSDSRQDREER